MVVKAFGFYHLSDVSYLASIIPLFLRVQIVNT